MKKLDSDEELRQHQENERNRQKKERYQSLKLQAEQLVQEQEVQEVDKLINDRNALLEQIHDSTLLKNEKQELERILKSLRDIITDKKERALLALFRR